MALIVNVHAAKTNLSKLIEAALSGEEVLIQRRGEPVVKLEPYTKKRKRKPGALKGKFGPIPDDFDAVTPEYLAMWGL